MGLKGRILGVCALAAALLVAPVAGATLISDTVDATLLVDAFADANFFDPGLGTSPVSVEVEEAAEFVVDFTILTGGTFIVTVDLDAESLTVSVLNTSSEGTFGGSGSEIFFEDLDWVDTPGEVAGFVFASGTDVGAIASFGPDSIHLDIPDFFVEGNATLTASWDIITRHGEVIPEPSTMLLLGVGVAGVAGRRLRRKA